MLTRIVSSIARSLRNTTHDAVHNPRDFAARVLHHQFRQLAEWTTYRGMAAVDTIGISLATHALGCFDGDFTSAITKALSVAPVEYFTKYPLNWVNDKGWSHIAWGAIRDEASVTRHIQETRLRAAARTVTYRVLASADTLMVARVMTGNWSYAASLVTGELATKALVKYVNNRLWSSPKAPLKRYYDHCVDAMTAALPAHI